MGQKLVDFFEKKIDQNKVALIIFNFFCQSG
jgi:hypothetical protein